MTDDAELETYVRRVSVQLTAEDEAHLRAVVERLQGKKGGKPVTWSDAMRAALRAVATESEVQ